MTTLTAAPASVTTNSRRRGLKPSYPKRVAPRPDAPFAAGLLVEASAPVAEVDPESSYSLSSILPKTCGFGLTGEEHDRVANARNRARLAFKADCPTAPYREVERVAEQAAKDEMRRVLRERPAAVEYKVVESTPAKPASVPFEAAKLATKPANQPMPRPRPTPRMEERFEPTTEDRVWWCKFLEQAANAPAPISGGSPESVREFSESWNLPSGDEEDGLSFSERCDLLPETEPELSDDANGAFGTGGVE